MSKGFLLLGMTTLVAAAQANPVPFCGENVLKVSGQVTQVCLVEGEGSENAVTITLRDSSGPGTHTFTYPFTHEVDTFTSQEDLEIENGGGQTAAVTVYRHYIPGTYPGDGENYPVAMEGKTPDGVVFKVVELKYAGQDR